MKQSCQESTQKIGRPYYHSNPELGLSDLTNLEIMGNIIEECTKEICYIRDRLYP